jgi:TetR/AcrR family transcriptional repressor of nem operon
MDTKTALLDAAENAARAFGIDGFSYADLAKKVGIRKASIHHHFPTKDDLVIALMRRYTNDLIASLDKIDAVSETAGQRLRQQIAHYRLALQGGQSLCLCAALSASRDSLSPEVVAELSSYRKTMLVWLADVFAKGTVDGTILNVGKPENDAAACLAVLEGAQLYARAEVDLNRFDEAVAQIIGRIL